MTVGTPSATEPSEASLIARCVSGQPEAQRELFRQQARAVHATLYRILGNNREIEDLIQETFIQVFRSLASFRGEAALSTWVGRITTRVAFAHIKRRKKRRERETAVQEIGSDETRPTQEEAVDARRALSALYQVLERLDAKHRIAYALHVIDGRPIEAVASLTSASLTATKSRIWRARREVNRRAQNDPRLARYLDRQGVAS